MKKAIIFIACLSIALPALAKKHDHGKNKKSLPPGLEKKLQRTGELPPGWQKKLAKGQILDPYLYRHARRLYDPPESKYPYPKAGTELLQIENRIIRIKKDTREILEILGIHTKL